MLGLGELYFCLIVVLRWPVLLRWFVRLRGFLIQLRSNWHKLLGGQRMFQIPLRQDARLFWEDMGGVGGLYLHAIIARWQFWHIKQLGSVPVLYTFYWMIGNRR